MTAAVETPTRPSLPDGQGLVRRPRRSALYSGNARAVFHRGMKSQWQGNLGVMLSGFLEPVLYLLAMGLGLGGMIGELNDPSGNPVSYAAYIAPALLATSAMNGAIFDSTWNVFFKLRISKLYQGMLNTSLGPMDIALGEIGVALVRGGIYASGFTLVMLMLGLISSWWAVLAVPACLLVAFGFAALGMAATSFLKTFQQMDWLTLVLTPMFLFSGTFYPIEVYPEPAQWAVMGLPLWHAVELLRHLAAGTVGVTTLGHASYFVALALVGTWAASARLKALFLR
ncbi:ABC transporter permease [Tessaracoccus sp. OS52]|uniref:ABC transporter permease n=1 Tax=Tessaracoccus sp. OS52 TaxID=2886691 RepID=UPI001D1028EB|nr:ABC transporter permease [Tessaracoccus sp. OS52]MCC2594228.1 ABC transporter permease [Tessaracoccus sp. OS52]